MVSLDDLKELVLYKKPFFLPIDPKDKRHNSAIILMTPSYQSSIMAMTKPYMINKKYFESYYLEKNITRYIKNESLLPVKDPGEYLLEEKLDTKERNSLDDSKFGLPELRKYPLNDKAHVLLAIKFFNHCPEEDRDKLAHNILSAIGKQFSEDEWADIHVGKNNKFFPYWEKSKYYKASIKENCISEFNLFNLNNIDKSIKKLVDIPKNIEQHYFNKFVDNSPLATLNIAGSKVSYLNKQMFNYTFSGYPSDIAVVSKYLNKESVTDCFRRMNKENMMPSNITLNVVGDPSVPENFGPNFVTIYTPNALAKVAPQSNYETYLKYILQLFAIYTLKPVDGQYYCNRGSVMDSLAEPAAIVLSGVINEKNIDNKKTSLNMERLFKYIIETEGIDHFIYLLAANNIKAFFEYAKEYTLNPKSKKPPYLKPISIRRVREQLEDRSRTHNQYLLENLKKFQECGYYANILDTDSVEETTPTSILDPIKSFDLARSTGGDYILEGNYVYLFEDSNKYNLAIKQALFKDRLKNNKEVIQIYKRVKNDASFIKYTFVDLKLYKNRNLFIDLSYYNESFFRNMSDLNSADKSNKPRIFNIYLELMERLLKDDKLNSYNKKTVFIPILDWRHNDSAKMWMYREDINPISAIYYMIKYNPSMLKKIFGDKDIVFLGGKNYFKLNFSKTNLSSTANLNKFTTIVKRIIALGYDLEDPDPTGELPDSPRGIAMDIIDKVEKSQKVTIDNVSKFSNLKKSISLISPLASEINVSKKPEPIEKNDQKQQSTDKSLLPVDTKAANSTTEDDKKDAIINAVAKAADNAISVDDAIKTLNTDEFKNMILSLQNDSEENVRVSKVQASAVINMQNEFHKKQVAGQSVEDLLKKDNSITELPKTKLNVSSINEDWKGLTFINFDKNYDLNADIIKMLDSMQHWTFPIAVKNIEIKDNSTSEDIIDLWKIECVDFRKNRFTLKVDIPKFMNGSNFLKLRGNEKALMIQSVLLPLIKTDLDECQIIGIGGYNKIFVRKFGNRVGQSMPIANNLVRALNKYMQSHKGIKITAGDNSRICGKYELPIDYIDLSQILNSIEVENTKIFFNQDELRKEYQVDDTKGIPIAVTKNFSAKDKKAVNTIIYFDGKSHNTIAGAIASILMKDKTFAEIYDNAQSNGARYSYSKASILNKEIPIVLICGYLEGLITTMNKAKMEYKFEQKLDKSIRHSDQYDYIRFSDGYLIYKVTYSSSLLMNGLKEHDTESYSLNEINSRLMYRDFFNVYGNFIEDGLENSYDCMLDPITKEILAKCQLPTDYVSVLIYASNLLADNKYVKHIDQAGRRWRRKELIAGYFYKALSTAYQDYSRSLRNNRKGTKMEIKQSAIIDLITSKDPALSDLSVNNAVNDVECANGVTNKGLVGLNVARGYTINTRGYDDSMLNLLGMDTNFSGTVGVNRQATIDANIEGGRGFVKTIGGNTNKFSAARTLTMTEAVTPLGITHDDPQRTLMTYIQTSKHMIRCNTNDPTLITTGADEALPYLTSDIFAYKAKQDGKIVELVQEGFGKQNYMIIEYKDKTHDCINLSEEVKKNSDGGYYVPMKLDTDLSVGKTFKAGDILAYDRLSFSNTLGESGNLAANIGTLAKVAIINTDEGYEDAAQVSEKFARKIGTSVIQSIETKIEKGSNIFVYKDIGDPVMEGDTLFAYQADFEDDVANMLLKNLTINTDQLSELGRNPVKSKYTGTVEDIRIYRTCELEDMSESLRKFVLKYENKVTKMKNVYKKYAIDDALLPKIGKVPEVGKTKNLEDAVLIIYYIKFTDKLSVGDKIVFYSANKGVIKYLVPDGEEPYTDFRPKEKIDSFMSLSSISGRMTCSIVIFAATSKLMVELDRSIKDLAGIPYDESEL